jgi:hypothetical protein
MRLPHVLLDKLGQSPGSRRSLMGGLALIAAATGSGQPVSGKKRGKKRCKRRKRCGKGCCKADACFASSVNAQNGEALGFACCSADKLCRSTKPNFQDQCCYPDETCQPSLADNPLTQTICCRPCASEPGGCCLNVNDECTPDGCLPSETARLARTRRPG